MATSSCSREYLTTGTMCGPQIGWYNCDHLVYINISCPNKDTEGHKNRELICDIKLELCPICVQPETAAINYVKSMLLTGFQLADILNADPFGPGFMGMVARFYSRGDHKHFNQPGPDGSDPEGQALVQRIDAMVQRLRSKYGTATFPLPEKFAKDIPGHAFDVALNEIAEGVPDTTFLDLNGDKVEPNKAADFFTDFLHELPGMADANANPSTLKTGLNSPPTDPTSASASPNQSNGQSTQESSSSQNASARVTPDPGNGPSVQSSSSSQNESGNTTPTSSNGQMRSSPGAVMSTSGTPAPANGQMNIAPMAMAMPPSTPVQGSMNNQVQFPMQMTPGAATFGQTPIHNQQWPQMPPASPVPMYGQIAQNHQASPMGTGLPNGSFNQGFSSHPQFPNLVFVSPASMYGQAHTPNHQLSPSPMGLPTGAYNQAHVSRQQSPQVPIDPALTGGQIYPQYHQPPSTPGHQAPTMAMGQFTPTFNQASTPSRSQTPMLMSSSTPSSKQTSTSMGTPMTPIQKGGRKRSESISPSSPTSAPKRGRKSNANRAQSVQPNLGTPNMNFDGIQGNKGKFPALAPAGPVVMTFDTKATKTPRKTPSPTKPKPKPKHKFSDKSVLIIEHPSMLNATSTPANGSVAQPAGTPTPAGKSIPFVNACIHSSAPSYRYPIPSQTPSSTPAGTAPKTPCSIPKGTKAKISGSAPTPSNQTDNTPITHFKEKSLADTIKEIPKKYPVFHKMYQTYMLKVAYEQQRDAEEKEMAEKKDGACCPCA